MITFNYSISKSWDTNSHQINLSSADEMTIRYNLFLGDIVMQIETCDFSTNWGWVPVLDFIISLNDIICELNKHSHFEIIFEFTESEANIKFERDGIFLLVSASYVQGTSKVLFDDFSIELEVFTSRVIKDILNNFPESKNNVWFNQFIKLRENKKCKSSI
jgi:hypothetical protein